MYVGFSRPEVVADPCGRSGHPRGALRDGAPSSAVDPLGGNDLSCVVHVHSTFSDGHATVEEMLADARAAGAGALLLTDHDSLEARRQGWEGWHDGVLLLVGHEISPRGGHLLAFGLEREIDHRGRGQRELTRAVAAAGGIGFAAHPFSDGGHMLWPALARRIVRPHGWEALEDPALTGIELWSFLTDAAEHWSTPRQALRWIRDAERLVDARPAGQVANWDRLATQRWIPPIGGLDARDAGVPLGRCVRAPLPNRRMFALLRTHLVCERRLTGTSTTTAKPSSRLFARARRSSPARTAVTSKAPASGPSSTPRSCEWDARPAPDLASFG